MTGFLDRLISRSIPAPAGAPAGDVLRPRLPSLFEDPPGADPGPLSFESGAEALEVQAPGKKPAVGVPDGGEPQPPFLTEMERGPHPAMTGFHPIESIQADGHPILPAGTGTTERRFGDVGSLRAREPGRTAGQPSAGPTPPPAPHQGETIPERGRAVPPAEPAVSPVDFLSAAQAALQPAPFPGVPSLAPATVRPAAAPAAFESMTDDRQAPIVQIHIGRIEVLASNPPGQPAVRPPASPRPKLSLDEYLRQRNEGKR